MRKILAGLTALALVVIGAVTLALPAQAHTGDLKASVKCDTSTGEYVVTYTLKTSNTSGKTGTTMWRVGNTTFDGTPRNGDGMDRGPITSKGNTTITLGSERLPGNTVGGGPWVYAWTTWSGATKGSDGRIEGLKGDCRLPDDTDSKKVTLCHATASQTNPYNKITVSVASFLNSGHIDHAGDIYPEFSYVKQGKTVNVAAKGDTSLLQYPDCAKPKPEQPKPLTGTEKGSDTVCVEPLNGNALVRTWEQTWSQEYVWDAKTWTWVLGEKVYEEKVVNEQVTSSDDCIPTKPEPKSGEAVSKTTPVCEEPKNGTLTWSVTRTSWTQDYVWSNGTWVLGDKIYGDPVTSTETKKADDCIPTKPAPLSGQDKGQTVPVCVDPLNGIATFVTWTQDWTQDHTWNGKKWVLGDKVFEPKVETTHTVPSDDCIPTKPEPVTGTESGSGQVCTEPADGTLTVISWTQDWTQDYVWSPTEGAWVLSDKVFDQKVVTETVVEDANCIPTKPEPETGTDEGSDAVCTEPLDGTVTVTSWTQDWTQDYTWTQEVGAWILGEKVYGEKAVTTTTEPAEDCEAITPPPTETAWTCADFPDQKAAQDAYAAGATYLDGDGDGIACEAAAPPAPKAPSKPALAVTGMDTLKIGLAGSALIALGVLLVAGIGRLRRES